MAGFDNEVVYGKNADFTSTDNQNVLESNGLVTNGKIWIGSSALNAGGTHINVGSITSPLGTLSIGYSSPNITLDLAGGGTAVEHLTGDSGGQLNPTANNFNILGQATPNTSGIQVTGSGSTLSLKMFSPFALGDFAFARSNSGATNTLTLSNTSNTASSASNMAITVAGATAADPQTTYTVTGATSWSTGIDNSDSDKYVIAASTALGTTNVMTLDVSGEVDVVKGNFRTVWSNSGSVVDIEVSNTSNTASSDSVLLATVAGSSGGDPYTRYIVGVGQAWSSGLDNSNADSYSISAATTLGATEVFNALVTGEITMPLQSAFSAYANANADNVTGDGTSVNPVVFGTEIFDQNNDFASNTYTCPKTGKVMLSYSILFQQVAATNSSVITIATSNNLYNFNNNSTSPTGNAAYGASVLADMDAGDTATIVCNFSGGTKTVDIYGAGGDPRTIFTGYLAC